MDARRNVTGGTAQWDMGRWPRWVASTLFAIAVALGLTGGALAQEGGPPYGWHDGNAGEVTATWQCGAFGWAVDPDNRDRDLQIQILADGNPVAAGTADLPREGLGDCPGGTCGFAINLWGQITAGLEHLIRAQAYDEETSTWFDLGGTPLPLTCWGYPEGFHDGSAGVVDRYSCGAWGWAADPDDRDRDLQVQILADGAPVATANANLLRPDVTACVGGTCGYSVDLWGLISPDVEHSIAVQAFDEESGQWLNLEATPKALTCTAPPPPAPSIWISTSNDYLRGNDFRPGETLTFTVYASEGEVEPFLELDRTTDVSGYAFIDGWEHGSNLMVGNYVVVSDGTSTRTLVLEPLTIDVFDPATDYVAGTTSPGELVHVVIGNNDVGYPAEMDVYAGEAGEWQANFAGIFDIPWDMWGSADVFDDDGDRTVFHLGASPPPTARLVVFPEVDSVHIWELPAGTEVHLTIDDPAVGGEADYEDTATVGPAPWDENQILAYFDFAGSFDVKVGDIVTISYLGTSVQHVVEFVSVTGTDADLDTVSGEAAPNEPVYVWQHGEDWAMQNPFAAEDGTWTADFTEIGLDLAGGACGRAEVRDEGGNSTAHDWCVPIPPNPRFVIFPDWEWIDAYDWPDGAPVTATVAGKLECVAQGTSSGGFFNMGFPEDCDVTAGDDVSLTDGVTTRVHTVRNLDVRSANAGTDAVSGTASPGETVYVWPHGEDWAMQSPTADGDGAWLADFTLAGFNLLPGTSGRAQIPDEAGNATAVDWTAPTPFLIAFPENDAVEGWEWPDGATVYLSVDDPNTPVSPDLSRVGTAAVTPWGDPRTYVRFEFGEEYDLGVGDVVTVTDSLTEVTHVVMNLAVADVDPQTDEIAGTADPGMQVTLWPHGFDQTATVLATAAGDGAWVADFSGLFDLVGWTAGRSEVLDEGGNATAVDWQVPLPVRIDIQPWSGLNRIACGYPTAWLPVAVFSAEGFDATQLNTDSIRFGRTGTEAEVVRLGRDPRPAQYASDVNHDGLMDMVYFFRLGDTGFGCGDIPAGQRSVTVEATLTGWMEGGIAEGSDHLTLLRLFGH